MFGSERGRILEQGRTGGPSSRIPELLEGLQKDFEQVRIKLRKARCLGEAFRDYFTAGTLFWHGNIACFICQTFSLVPCILPYRSREVSMQSKPASPELHGTG
jgi:hypothetical protein